MNLKEIIYKRKSTRKYQDKDVEQEVIDKIYTFINNAKPLYEDIKVGALITSSDEMSTIQPWKSNQVICIYSEEKDGYLENVGFIFQQLDLYLNSIGLGSCWIGMGKPNKNIKEYNGLKFVIMFAFGYPKEELYRNASEFKRLELSKISDELDERLECARLAPSSVNSQPWYFKHEGDLIHLYYEKRSLISKVALNYFNQIDLGIVLAHIYVENEDSFKFIYNEVLKKNNKKYIGSFKI